MKRPSLHRRLLWLAGVPVVALWLAASLWLALRTRHETTEMFDRELERTAASVLAVIASTPDAALSPALPDRVVAAGDDEQRPEIMVRGRDGRVLLDRSSLPVLDYAADAPHFHTIDHAGERWRVYQREDAAGRHWIQVAAPLHDRDELLAAHVRASLLPLLALLLLLPLATWLGLRRGLAPLRALSRAIAAQPARTPTLTRDDVPGELLQLTRALDALVGSLDQALARERRFTADAAHELRHPLAVLRMELDLAGSVADADARRQHLQRAHAGLERMERLVAQLLTLARVESLEGLPDAATLSLATLAREVLAAAGERAAPRDVALSLRERDAGRVRGSAGLLAIALHNLVDNAVAHGRRHGRVEVTVARRDAQVELAVADDGPGFPAGLGARLGERFLHGGGGSGLGLSIVQAIAVLHGGDLEIGRADGGGARAVLRLPALAAASPDAAVPARGNRNRG
ncbi:ATP-binding protein [Cognatiluteimonas weifangensis]|uniref:histidine kinase n=1 Tax=Cognatiluteimonas weifangensis TaxID=2303539 RepID=A0A372DNT1_9GAMM|nr:ATP-binding protein [Luteimonas weifangensis]RFP61134.1 two-component sensor histidine kinase [Luteimonas weifangensis]